MTSRSFMMLSAPVEGAHVSAKFDQYNKALADQFNKELEEEYKKENKPVPEEAKLDPMSWDEQKKEDWPNLHDNYRVIGGVQLVHNGDFWVPQPDQQYNCLGWVMNQVENLSSTKDYWTEAKLHEQMAKLGYVEVAEDKALVDVWYSPSKRTKELKPGHVSKRTSITDTKWTSKLGPQGPLIEHERNDIGGGVYGTVKKHYGPPTTPPASTSHAPAPSLAMEPEAAQELTPPSSSDDDVEIIHAHAQLAAVVKSKPKPVPIPKPTSRPPAKPTTPKPVPGSKPPAKPPTTKPPTTKPPTTKPPTTKPPTTKPPTTKPPTTNSPKSTNPAQSSQSAQANFDHAFYAWKKTWYRKPAFGSSDEDGFTQTSQFEQLIKLGPSAIPMLVAKLTAVENTYAVVAYKFLDKKTNLKGGSLRAQRDEILKLNAKRTKTLAANVQNLAIVRDQALFSLPSLPGALTAAAKLTANPLFREIVKEGGHAVVHILEDYVKTGTHGKAIWEEALLEIYKIEKENGNVPQEVQEFEQWLATYTGDPVQNDDGTEVQPAGSEGTEAPPASENTEAPAEDTDAPAA
ncbi:hypothetical protein GQ53DRAFT_825347 [Thozetella sp. PMI_491]|nr:hypothetical protein GQ53DRAFT_825347 [Thozetella sp. PMI_491]